MYSFSNLIRIFRIEFNFTEFGKFESAFELKFFSIQMWLPNVSHLRIAISLHFISFQFKFCYFGQILFCYFGFILIRYYCHLEIPIHPNFQNNEKCVQILIRYKTNCTCLGAHTPRHVRFVSFNQICLVPAESVKF